MSSLLTRVLSDSEVQRIHETSLRVLEQVGVDICHAGIHDRLLATGARQGATNSRVLLPEPMVAEALALCPREIVLGSVRGDTYRMALGERIYSSCVVDPWIIAYREGKRPPWLQDCVANARLVDALDLIALPYLMDVDYADAVGRDALLAGNLAFMSNMSKHYICAPHDVEAARIWMEMSEILAGASLPERRIVSVLVSPTSPLKFDRYYLELVEFLLPYNVMFILLPCPQTGATAPFPLAGTVVDFNVENLAAITVIQTLWPGTPLHYHHVAMGFDMRTALSSLGGPEKALLAVAGADMGSFYGLSCGCAGSATDSAAYDIQNGAETMAQLLLTVGSRANLITGIGSLGNAMATSQEQILFDCELISVADYLRKGIQVDEERLAFAAFARLGPGGDFLSDELTLKLLRSGEHFPAASLQRAGVTAKQTMYEALYDRAQEILRTHRPAVPEDRIEDLRRYIVDRQPAIEESLS